MANDSKPNNPVPEVEQRNKGKTAILVVEDERHIARFLQYVLERAGYLVEVTHEGEKVPELARKLQPKAVLLDLMLPGISGLDVLEALRREVGREDLIVVVLTARSLEEQTKAFLEKSADAYCVKPIAPSALLSKLKELGVHP